MPPINQSTIFCKTHSVLPEVALGTLPAGRPSFKHACIASCIPIVSRRAVAVTPTSQLHPTLDKDYSTVNASITGSEFVTFVNMLHLDASRQVSTNDSRRIITYHSVKTLSTCHRRTH
jgi:hypothetical protein